MNFWICRLLAVLVVAVGFVATGHSQAVKVNGGSQTMSITTGIANGQPVSVVNTTCSLTYRRQAKIAKITVATSCPGQRYNLSVVATNVTKGAAAPQVSLVNGSPAIDFLTDVPRTGTASGTCTLQYTASATFSQGNSAELGDDVHVITYTIQAQ